MFNRFESFLHRDAMRRILVVLAAVVCSKISEPFARNTARNTARNVARNVDPKFCPKFRVMKNAIKPTVFKENRISGGSGVHVEKISGKVPGTSVYMD